MREVVPQALYCYCAGHALNLVIQHFVKHGSLAENALTLVSSVVNYVKMSIGMRCESWIMTLSRG